MEKPDSLMPVFFVLFFLSAPYFFLTIIQQDSLHLAESS